MGEYQTIINIGAGASLAGIGWFARQLWDAVQELKEELADIREDIAKHYVPKADFKEAMSEIRSMFSEIRTILNDKADKA